ncbi:MAG: hypothetical protein KDC87_06445 [Planctomycetes bacterium]|nr:hypothetical protein [Planctomycetota bacterium]MCB9869004.1 hypothetical protein [Planctomycetota bacterium]MCB9887964.1 hypothetical protein [Planctomycetota bacterium]
MRLLCFLAKRFRWKSHSKTLADAVDADVEQQLRDCVVAFVHAEPKDELEGAQARALRHALKHLKWMANKRELTNVVLHSFTHLGTESAAPAFAEAFLAELAARLSGTGYDVACTPFGYFCEWDLEVHGESLAKVFKEI